jgi:P pilus assembly chaperone PapD
MRTPVLAAAALAAASLAAVGLTSARAQAPAPQPQASSPVVANINITPKRVTFDPNRRNATVFVINQGASPITIDVTMVDRVMGTDGQIVSADDAAKKPALQASLAQLRSAKDLLQISPRRVTLQPGKGQTVRIRLAALPPAPLAAEYRTHLTVTTVPARDAGVTAEAAAAANANNDHQLSFRINAVYGVSIPAIVRTAPAQPQAQLTNLRLETVEVTEQPNLPPKKIPALALDIVRQGSNSLYGAFEVRSQRQKRGEPALGVARGVGVYPEIDHRTVLIPLTRNPAPGEKLDVTFTDDDSSPGKVIAKSTL